MPTSWKSANENQKTLHGVFRRVIADADCWLLKPGPRRAGHAGWSACGVRIRRSRLDRGGCLLVLLMLFPLAAIFRTSLWDETGLTLSNYAAVFTNPFISRRSGTPCCFLPGSECSRADDRRALGWLVTRTDFRGKSTVRALVMASFVTPPFLGRFCLDAPRRAQRRMRSTNSIAS